MHTNEENKPLRKDTTVRMGKPGEQVAVNRTMHGNIFLYENESGEYYPVVEWDDAPKLVRGEYHPIGNRMHFPKAWGRKHAATTLLNRIIEDKEKQIADAQRELVKLRKCLGEVGEWPEYD